MHEISLIAEMMNMVRESAAHNNITRISRIKLVVGKLTMAMPHSLRFAFHTMARDGLFQGAELLIEEREVAYQCCQCGEKYLPDMPYGQLCPNCGSKASHLLSGRELFVEYYEGDSGKGEENGANTHGN